MGPELTLHGAKGTGAVAVEAALTLLNLPYQLNDAPPLGETETSRRFAAINPMRQVPALLLPSGELLTESAAILIWLADAHPAHRLSPTVGSRERPAFLKWMSFVSAAIYSLFWILDEPSRVVDDERQKGVVKERLTGRIAHCWTVMETQLSPGLYLLGDDLSVLDLYVSVISRWEPSRSTFYARAPRMAEVVRRVDADPRLADLWATRFPFIDGWEG